MLQLVLWNLLIPDPQWECSSALQGVAEGEETLQVVVLVQENRQFVVVCYMQVEGERQKATEEQQKRQRNRCNKKGCLYCSRVNTCCVLSVCVCAVM